MQRHHATSPTATKEATVAPPPSPVSHRGTVRRRQAIFVAGALFSTFLVFHGDGAMINNGDYWRAAVYFRIRIPDWQPTLAVAPLRSGLWKPSGPPSSLLGDAGWLVAKGMDLVGARTLHLVVIALVLATLYYVGVALAAQGLRSRQGVVTAVVFTVLFALLGFYLRSFYAEALVLVLSPWLFWALIQLRTKQRWWPVAAVMVLLLLTTDEVAVTVPGLLLVLLVMARPEPRKAVLIGLCGLSMVLTLSFMAWESNHLNLYQANSYDRLYNGVGLSLGGVATWPSANLENPSAFLTAHPGRVPRNGCGHISPIAWRYLGTSFSPTGAALAARAAVAGRRSSVGRLESTLVTSSNWSALAADTLACPRIAMDVAANANVLALRLNYDVHYIRPWSTHVDWPTRLFLALQGAVLRHLGLVLAACGAGVLVALKTWRRRLVTAAVLAWLPIGIVLGDGYYEFAKHLSAIVMLAPVLWLVVRRDCYGAARARPPAMVPETEREQP